MPSAWGGSCTCGAWRKEHLLSTISGMALVAYNSPNLLCDPGTSAGGLMFLRFRTEDTLHRSRLSLNQITTPRWSVAQATEACVRREIPSIALWRHKIAEQGLHESV